MEPTEIKARLAEIAKPFGKSAHISVGVSRYTNQLAGYAMAYLSSPAGAGDFTIYADTWEALLAEAAVKASDLEKEIGTRVIHRMALKIIECTAVTGECTDADLRLGWFDDAQIQRFGAEACAMADSMAGNGPFKIVEIQGSNAKG